MVVGALLWWDESRPSNTCSFPLATEETEITSSKEKSVFEQASPSCFVSSWAKPAVHRWNNNSRTWRDCCACRVWEISSFWKTITSKTQSHTISSIHWGIPNWECREEFGDDRQQQKSQPQLTEQMWIIQTFHLWSCLHKLNMFCSWLKACEPHSNWWATCAPFLDGKHTSDSQTH